MQLTKVLILPYINLDFPQNFLWTFSSLARGQNFPSPIICPSQAWINKTGCFIGYVKTKRMQMGTGS